MVAWVVNRQGHKIEKHLRWNHNWPSCPSLLIMSNTRLTVVHKPDSIICFNCSPIFLDTSLWHSKLILSHEFEEAYCSHYYYAVNLSSYFIFIKAIFIRSLRPWAVAAYCRSRLLVLHNKIRFWMDIWSWSLTAKHTSNISIFGIYYNPLFI